MDSKQLWAKSHRKHEEPRPSMLLPQHLKDTHIAAGRILDATGDAQLAALGLPLAHYRDRFRRCVLFAAAVHDLGKANDHFQGMICGERWDTPQGIRHEWVTVLMLQTLKPWFVPTVLDEADFAVVTWSVAGHHPAFTHDSPPRSGRPGAGPSIHFRTNEPDFTAILDWLASTFPVNPPCPVMKNDKLNLVGGSNLFAQIGRLWLAAKRTWDAMPPDERRIVAAVKAAVIAADVAASALPEQSGESIAWDWINQSFREVPQPSDLEKISKKRLGGKPPRTFQESVCDSKTSITFVKAGCGTGKTVAAYMWAAKRHANRRLYFCYPTTGTATEGYKDYLYDVDVKSDLFHSRREVDFEIILGTRGDAAADDGEIRIASLNAWATPIVNCTVDTVLGLVQNSRKGLYAWPALAQSAFVFDEIHAYDDRLFGALLRFLRDLPGLPVLLMTASLPRPREDALKHLFAERGIEWKAIEGPREIEEKPRYHKLALADNDPLPIVEAELKAGGKVLWVCNTVKRVMDAADRAAHFNPKIYHSRFKYEDRVQRHKQVVEAFTPAHAGGVLAICSQVAEMSLDLKGCTLLVTDRAPVPAMIQRLGRLNRQGDSPTRPFVVVEVDDNLPYAKELMDPAVEWLNKLPQTNLSQADLAAAWEQSAGDDLSVAGSAWLDGGPITDVLPLREGSPGITVLMAEDLARVKANPCQLGRYTLPMPEPKVKDWHGWESFRGIPVAPAGTIDYYAKRGAQWQKQ